MSWRAKVNFSTIVFLRHSRAGGRLENAGEELDSRLRGNDDRVVR